MAPRPKGGRAGVHNPSRAPETLTALRRVRAAAILPVLPRPTPKGATFSVARRRLRLSPSPAALGEETQRSAGSWFGGAAAIWSRRWGWGGGGGGERFAAASSLGPCQLAASATALQNTSENVPGPPSSPTDQRPEGLEGPRVEVHDPVLAALSAGTDLAVLFAG